jgi:tetratricopeptide (TPR) repeat protein
MTDPKIDSILDEANRLFLQGKLQEAISYYDKILEENPNHLGCLNNKGYALSKLKDFDSALQCYNSALKMDPEDIPVQVNKVSSLRKKGELTEALFLCDKILENNPNYNIALYHKERILLSMKKFHDSILYCDKILEDYPNNGDVLFDKACNLIMLSQTEKALDSLENSISQGTQYKVKAKNSKFFTDLTSNSRFQSLIS